MLAFQPPYRLINGVTLLPDHADSRVAYALPVAPRLALTPDGRPDFSLVQFLGGGAGAARIAGGLLTFSAELPTPALSPDSSANLTVRPVLFDSGRVELIALGVSSLAEVATAAPFDVRVLGSGTPSLGGDNRVTFQLLLDANAAELIEKLLDAPDLPLVLVYRMQLSGLRPSYRIAIEADWHKVYTHLQNRLHVNAYYVSADVDVAIHDALEANDIRIDTTVFGSSESDRSAAQAARRQMVDWVLERMFEPLFDTTPGTAATVAETVEGVVSSVVRALVPGVSYRLRALSQSQTRHFNIRLDETVAEQREIVPQGTLGALFRAFQLDGENRPNPAWPALRHSLVQKVNLNGFPRLEITLAAEDRFTSDGIARLEVELRRPDGSAPRSFTLRSAADRHTWLVNLLGAANPFDLPYEYRTTVHFDPASPFGARPAAQTAWQTGRSAALFVEPRQAYQMAEISVMLPPTFRFDQFAAVVADLQYGDQRQRLTFSEATPQTWRFRHTEPEMPAWRCTVSYLRPPAADAADIILPPLTTTDTLLSLRHPAPHKRMVQLLVNLPVADLIAAFVELAYDDPAHGIRFDERIDLTGGERFLLREYAIADGGPQTLRYRLTLFTPGRLVEGEWRSTEETRLVIDSRLLENRVVTVRPLGGTLTENGLETVRVTLQQRSADQTVRHETQIVWQQTPTASSWEFPLGDPPVRALHLQATFVDRNGFVNRLPWRSSEAANLLIHLSQQTVIAP